MPGIISKRLKQIHKQKSKRKGPLWKGPAVDGITYSLLSRFLVCRERFRIHAMLGIRPAPEFRHRMEYGTMWHVCEEAYSKGMDYHKPLMDYCGGLCEQYQTQQEEINHWYNVCRSQFLVYIDYWKMNDDAKNKKPLLQEETFRVQYTLPTGRVVLLRGRWDAVDLIGRKGDRGIYLQENKTMGDIDESAIQRRLKFDLQTMLYLVALRNSGRVEELPERIRGVRYNVVRRPLSGGLHTIRKHKATRTKPEETDGEFYGRLREIIQDDPRHFFFRWKVDISDTDMERFEVQCLRPILENLCDWYTAQKSYQSPWDDDTHYRSPYGIYNPLEMGRGTDLDDYLESGDMTGLVEVDNLFPEL